MLDTCYTFYPPLHAQAILHPTKPADVQQVTVINHGSHGTLQRLNGNKFVRVWCMSSQSEDESECAFLVCVYVEEKCCFSPLIYISLASERQRDLHSAFFVATSNPFRAWKDSIDPLSCFYRIQVVHLIQHTVAYMPYRAVVPKVFCLMWTLTEKHMSAIHQHHCHVPNSL